jgi:hypothetical protein
MKLAIMRCSVPVRGSCRRAPADPRRPCPRPCRGPVWGGTGGTGGVSACLGAPSATAAGPARHGGGDEQQGQAQNKHNAAHEAPGYFWRPPVRESIGDNAMGPTTMGAMDSLVAIGTGSAGWEKRFFAGRSYRSTGPSTLLMLEPLRGVRSGCAAPMARAIRTRRTRGLTATDPESLGPMGPEDAVMRIPKANTAAVEERHTPPRLPRTRIGNSRSRAREIAGRVRRRSCRRPRDR